MSHEDDVLHTRGFPAAMATAFAVAIPMSNAQTRPGPFGNSDQVYILKSNSGSSGPRP